jgi:hypothetical protein
MIIAKPKVSASISSVENSTNACEASIPAIRMFQTNAFYALPRLDFPALPYAKYVI